MEEGLKLYGDKKYSEALKRFLAAIKAEPRPEEAQAAYYNAACCHVKLKEWQDAADAVSTAVNEYSLSYKVAMEVCVQHLLHCASFPPSGNVVLRWILKHMIKTIAISGMRGSKHM